MKKISIVIPLYNEERSVIQTYKKLVKIIDDLVKEYTFEIILVDDGSTDKTSREILSICRENNIVKGILLSRNFGKEIALSAGIEGASGDAIITLDGGGQHPVDKIPMFLKEWEQGYEIAYNKRHLNTGASLIKKITSRMFYYFFNLVSEFKMEEGTTDYRLLDRKVVDYFLKFREKNRSYRGLTDWMGFHKKALIFDSHKRVEGSATYSYKKLIKLALNSLTSFSLFPLKLVGYLGLFITLLSSILAIFIVVDKFFLGNTYNFTNISIIIVFNTWIMGIVLVSLGFIALYIANIHEEVLRRPIYIVREKINFGKGNI